MKLLLKPFTFIFKLLVSSVLAAIIGVLALVILIFVAYNSLVNGWVLDNYTGFISTFFANNAQNIANWFSSLFSH